MGLRPHFLFPQSTKEQPTMATAQRRRRASAGSTPPAQENNARTRVQLEYVDITDLQPYPYNPRLNEGAVDSLANSIRSFGFLVPVVIDADNVVVAGHTRIEAAKKLGMLEVPSLRATHLTEEQVNAFRLIDNKVAELAKWDFDLLSGEIGKLRDSGLTLTDFGWTREELDCLSDMVNDDCLSAEGLIDAQASERIRRAERRAPSTARCVLGEIVFFIPATDYRTWVDGLRTLHDYDETAIIRDIRERLGLPQPQ